ncbi:MAG: neutral/alkaline non-lysosomal ceramidase N-terminal domain-containing protein [Tunicatimonas sp.]|uniref:neutral/alkaline non-lysosomal ceramidase N-terminal domain-containing protein n=1 Tax=Tunicatimonas sp. TaxID=1940096 RepID=UPI003C75F37F
MAGRKILRAAAGGILISFITYFALFQRVDHRPLAEQPYYQLALQQLDSTSFLLNQNGTFEVGWSKRNITPSEPAHLMGYGWKGDYQRVQDSLWVRSIILRLDTMVVGIVSYDLMLTPPLVVEQVQAALSSVGIDYVYFSAIHTHKGYGGWEQGFGRELIADWYDPNLVKLLVNQTIASLREAHERVLPGKIAYVQFALDSLVNNRLIRGGPVEPYLRAIYFQKEDGTKAIFSSFPAHATFTDSKLKNLSADYPGELVRQLERDAAVEFAMFAAGAVGSHSPHRVGLFSYEKLQAYASHIASPLLTAIDSLPYDSVTQLGFAEVNLPLGDPQLRITENWRVRPLWFRQFLGTHFPKISFLQLNELTLVGTPGDFSGLLYNRIGAETNPAIITSFNGEYIGYLIPSEHYHLNHRETRSINWYGPYTGDYVTDIINRYLSLTPH